MRRPAGEGSKRCLLVGGVIAAVALVTVETQRLPRLSAASVALSPASDPQACFIRTQRGRPVADLAAGRLLVARRDSPDPNFAETVILLIHYNERSAMGLILNRPTKVPLSRLFGELESAKGRSDPVYMGGPVALGGVLALLRSRTKPDDARHVLDDVYMVSSKELLEEAIVAGTESTALRVYMGYAGWGPGQLEGEIKLGAWHIFEGDAGAVFDPDPGSLWERFIRRTEVRIATGPSAPPLETLRRVPTFIDVH